MQQHGFVAPSDGHILVKDSIGDCCRNFLADDGFKRTLVCYDQCAVILEDLSAADVVRVSVGEDYVLHRNVKTPPDLVAQPGRSAGHSRIDDQGALLRHQDQAAMHGQTRPCGMAIKVSLDWLETTRSAGQAAAVKSGSSGRFAY
jgi:hypothetical protein